MTTFRLKLLLAVVGGWISLFVVARMGGELWELLLSLVLPGLLLFAMDWLFDRIWPRPNGKDGS